LIGVGEKILVGGLVDMAGVAVEERAGRQDWEKEDCYLPSPMTDREAI
jgi:hypothetical protein